MCIRTQAQKVCVCMHISVHSLIVTIVVNTGWDQVLGALTANTEPQRTKTPNPRRTTLAALWVRAFRVWGC